MGKYPDTNDAFPAPCYDPNAPADDETGVEGLCSGWYGPDNLEIVDTVRVPATLKPGPYVVQWRWDCEESSQIWLNCADVTVKASSITVVQLKRCGVFGAFNVVRAKLHKLAVEVSLSPHP